MKRVTFSDSPPDVCLLIPDAVEFAEFCFAKYLVVAGKWQEEHRELLQRLTTKWELISYSRQRRGVPGALGAIKPLPVAPAAPAVEVIDDTSDGDDDYDDPEKEVRWYRQTRLYRRADSGNWTLQAHGELEVVEDSSTQLATIEVTDNSALKSLLNEPICFKSELQEGPFKGVSWVLTAPGARPVCVEFDAPFAAHEFLDVFETYRQRARKALVLTPSSGFAPSCAKSRATRDRYVLV